MADGCSRFGRGRKYKRRAYLGPTSLDDEIALIYGQHGPGNEMIVVVKLEVVVVVVVAVIVVVVVVV